MFNEIFSFKPIFSYSQCKNKYRLHFCIVFINTNIYLFTYFPQLFVYFIKAINSYISLCIGIKGIVHPKMKILSSFTHPQVVPNLYECVCYAEHKGRYSEECGKQSSSGAPLTSIVYFFLLWKSMVPQNSLVTNFLQNIFLCVRQNKEIYTGLELLEGE